MEGDAHSIEREGLVEVNSGLSLGNSGTGLPSDRHDNLPAARHLPGTLANWLIANAQNKAALVTGWTGQGRLRYKKGCEGPLAQKQWVGNVSRATASAPGRSRVRLALPLCRALHVRHTRPS